MKQLWKPTMKKYLLGLLLATPLLLGAKKPEPMDFAQSWPLSLGEDAASPAYHVMMRDLYGVNQADISDVQVFDAQGKPMPTAIFSASFAVAAPPPVLMQKVPLSFYSISGDTATNSHAVDYQDVVSRGKQGDIRSITTVLAPEEKPQPQWLIDASTQGTVTALELAWDATETGREMLYRLEGSNDLQDWKTLAQQVRLLDAVGSDGKRLQQSEVQVQQSMRYLRLIPVEVQGDLQLTKVMAKVTLPSVPESATWETQWADGKRGEEKGKTIYEFEQAGRYPVARVNVALAEKNAVVQWTLQSRDAKDKPWVQRAGPWVGYQANADGQVRNSPSQQLTTIVRDKYWRLQASTDIGDAIPTLTWGYQPETLVFLAQGTPPYSVAYGSVNAQREVAPVKQMLDALKQEYGQNWRPALAQTTGDKPVRLAGDAALKQQFKVNWRTVLLWALLAGGALLVMGFAFSLLRRSNTK